MYLSSESPEKNKFERFFDVKLFINNITIANQLIDWGIFNRMKYFLKHA